MIVFKVPSLGVRGGLCNPSYWDRGIQGLLVDREAPKGSKCLSEGQQYNWGSTSSSVHTVIPLGSD